MYDLIAIYNINILIYKDIYFIAITIKLKSFFISGWFSATPRRGKR